MSENDPTFTPPTPSHVVPGDRPDPVVSTAPTATPAAGDRNEDVDDMLSDERPVVLPPGGPQTGVVIPPVK